MEALIGSLDDALSDGVILSELRAINAASGLPFAEVFASVKKSRAAMLDGERPLESLALFEVRGTRDHTPAAN
jgi:protein-disulfide isomerase-like protein with CxxC motif